MKCSLDNDVLSDILNSPERTDFFIDFVRSNECDVFVSSEVHAETTHGMRKDFVVARNLKFGKLLSTGSIRIIKPMQKVVEIELHTPRRKPTTPVIGPERTAEMAAYLSNQKWVEQSYDKIEPDRVEHHALKNSVLASDQKLNDMLEARDDWNSDDLVNDVRNFDGLAMKLRHFEYGFNTLRIGKPDLSIRLFKRAVLSGDARISHAVATLVHFRFLTYLMGDSGNEFSHLNVKERGNWHDLVNAATAAYCDYYVTNDRKLTTFCNELYRRKIIGFECISENDYFSKF